MKSGPVAVCPAFSHKCMTFYRLITLSTNQWNADLPSNESIKTVIMNIDRLQGSKVRLCWSNMHLENVMSNLTFSSVALVKCLTCCSLFKNNNKIEAITISWCMWSHSQKQVFAPLLQFTIKKLNKNLLLGAPTVDHVLLQVQVSLDPWCVRQVTGCKNDWHWLRPNPINNAH